MSIDANLLDLIKTIASCLAFFALIFAGIQIRIAKRNVALNSFKSIYDDHFKIRKKFENAMVQRANLFNILQNYDANTQDIFTIYSSAAFDDLREIGFHYEFIGILVRKNLIPKDLVFELILFPDKFWKDSQEFITDMRSIYYRDFWQNFELLKSMYEKKRLKKLTLYFLMISLLMSTNLNGPFINNSHP